MVDETFISFLKGKLGKMVGIGLLTANEINVSFWDTWPRRFYNIKSYDLSKVTKWCYTFFKKSILYLFIL